MKKAHWKRFAKSEARMRDHFELEAVKWRKMWEEACVANDSLTGINEELNAQIELLRNYGQRDDLTVDQGL